MKWSLFLADQAKEWATKLPNDCAFYHPGPSYGYESGQNLFVAKGYVPTAEQVLRAWVENEYQCYDPAGSGSCTDNNVCGHSRK